MLRLSLALSTLSLLLFSTAAYGQSLGNLNRALNETGARAANAKAIAALKRLEKDLIVYHSLADFEADGRLARVPLQIFEGRLREVSAELEPLLNRMPAGKLKLELANALDSYRDGVFWWRQIDQPGIVNVAALADLQSSRTPSDTAFRLSIPYTVAIHWRQAEKYLRQAEQEVR
jgi:hypothetical protein